MDNKNLFLKKYEKVIGKEIITYINHFKYINNNRQKTIRVNTLKTTIKKFEEEINNMDGISLYKIKELKFGYRANADFSIGSSIQHLQGKYYIQSIPSQFTIQIMDLKKDSLVLDMAASPGGKTTLISQFMENTGLIIAIEKYSHRIRSLKANLQRMNTKNVIAIQQDAEKFRYDEKFDYILLDAPCSGNFSNDKNWFKKRTLKDIVMKQKIQFKLIKKALQLLKEQGTLVYSTCSIEPEENEEVISYILSNSNAKLKPISIMNYGSKALKLNIPYGNEISQNCIRFWPHIHNTEGFFICKLTI